MPIKGNVCKDKLLIFIIINVSPQMTLTADKLIFHKICATYDIETILGRFGPLEVPHAGKWYHLSFEMT